MNTVPIIHRAAMPSEYCGMIRILGQGIGVDRMDKADDDKQHKVAGMSDYVQFRLVQGAADKEQRFIHAVVNAMATGTAMDNLLEMKALT
jgi:hypothetical protein